MRGKGDAGQVRRGRPTWHGSADALSNFGSPYDGREEAGATGTAGKEGHGTAVVELAFRPVMGGKVQFGTEMEGWAGEKLGGSWVDGMIPKMHPDQGVIHVMHICQFKLGIPPPHILEQFWANLSRY